MRKFKKSEIDLLYEQLKPDEEVLWKSKPNLAPDFTILTTLFFFFLAAILITVIVSLNDKTEVWFILSMILVDIGIILYSAHYAYSYYQSINHIFYVITSYRLAIFDTKVGKISVYKRYNLIKILRVKKTVFNTASIIFDVDFKNESMKEIGFINVNNADKVLAIIKEQLTRFKIESDI